MLIWPENLLSHIKICKEYIKYIYKNIWKTFFFQFQYLQALKFTLANIEIEKKDFLRQ